MMSGMLVIAWIFHLRWLVQAVTITAALCALLPPVADLVNRAWMALGRILGAINSTILLGFIFFIILTPIALLSRVFRKKDSMMLQRPKPTVQSFYTEREHRYTRKDLEKMW